MTHTRQLFEIKSPDGPLVASLSEKPQEISRQKKPIVVLATGDGPSGSKGQTWTQLLPMLTSAGFAALLFDFKGIGYSKGVYEELTLSMGCRNLEAVLDYIAANEMVAPPRGIGILGASFGGNVALLVAAHRPEITALALKSPSSFLPEGYQVQYGSMVMEEWARKGYHPAVGLNYTSVTDALMHNTYYEASKLNIPVRIVQGDCDSAVPIRQSRDLVRVMPNATLRELSGVDHWYSEGDSWDTMANDLVYFLRKNLLS